MAPSAPVCGQVGRCRRRTLVPISGAFGGVEIESGAILTENSFTNRGNFSESNW